MSVAAAEPLFADEFDGSASRGGRRWPVWTCVALAALFMFASDTLDAVNRWHEQPKGHNANLSVSVEGGSGARQVAFVLLGCWGVVAAMRPGGRPMRMWPPMAFAALLFLGWALASVLWSVDREFTIKRLFVLTCFLAGVAGFVRQFRLRDVALLALIGGTMQMVASVAADLAWAPGTYGASGYRLSGLQHPNHSGLNAAFLVLASLAFFDFTRLRRFAALAIVASIVLSCTKSRSSLIACAAACVTLAILRCPPRRLFVFALAAALLASGVLALEASGMLGTGWTGVVYLGRGDAEQTQLTGRPMIWAAALEAFGSDPTRLLTGVGYATFWTPATAEYVSARLDFGISEGHNGYFDTLLALGVVGVACMAFVLLASAGRWAWLARRDRRPWPAFAAALAVLAIVHCLTESTLVDPNFPTFISYACVAFVAFRAPRSESSCAS